MAAGRLADSGDSSLLLLGAWQTSADQTAGSVLGITNLPVLQHRLSLSF